MDLIENIDNYNENEDIESLDLNDETNNEDDNANEHDTMIQSIQSIQSLENSDNLKEFSKNSIINLARKAGVKCISQCGIEKVRIILNDKLKCMTEKLESFYRSNTGKTITKKMVTDFLHSEGIHMTMS